MTTATQKKPHVRSETSHVPDGNGESRFLLTGVRWQTYAQLCRDLDEQHVRLNYDSGRLEIVMATSRIHEIYKWLLGQFVIVLAEELGLPLAAGGSMTFHRQDLEKGLEPDDCYWIRNAARVKGKGNIDFQNDPAPDVVIEIEITSTLVNRLPILAALKVAEVWKYDQEQLLIGLLQPDGTYAWGETSGNIPEITAADLLPFLERADSDDHVEIIRSFRKWVRDHLVKAKP